MNEKNRDEFNAGSGIASLLAASAVIGGLGMSVNRARKMLPRNPFVSATHPVSTYEAGVRGVFKNIAQASPLEEINAENLLRVMDYENFLSERLSEIYSKSQTAAFISEQAKLYAPQLQLAVESSLSLAYQKANLPPPNSFTPEVIKSTLGDNITLQYKVKQALSPYLKVDPFGLTSSKLKISDYIGARPGKMRGRSINPNGSWVSAFESGVNPIKSQLGLTKEEILELRDSISVLERAKYSVSLRSGRAYGEMGAIPTGIEVTKGKTQLFVPFVQNMPDDRVRPNLRGSLPPKVNRNLAGWGVYTDALGNLEGYAVKVGKKMGNEIVSTRADLAAILAMAEVVQSGGGRSEVFSVGKRMKSAFREDKNIIDSDVNYLRYNGAAIADPLLPEAERIAIAQKQRMDFIHRGVNQGAFSPDATQAGAIWREVPNELITNRIGGEIFDPKSHQPFKRAWDIRSISDTARKFGLQIRADSVLHDTSIKYNTLNMGVVVAPEERLRRALSSAGFEGLLPSPDEMIFDPRLLGVSSLNRGMYTLMSEHPVGTPIHSVLNSLKNEFGEEKLARALETGTVGSLISKMRTKTPNFGIVKEGTFLGVGKAGEAVLTSKHGGTDFIDDIMIQPGKLGSQDLLKVSYTNRIGIQQGFKVFGGVKAMMNMTHEDLVKKRSIKFQFGGRKRVLKETTKDLMAAAIETDRLLGYSLPEEELNNLFSYKLGNVTAKTQKVFLDMLETVRGVAGFATAGPGASLEVGSAKVSKALGPKKPEFITMLRNNIQRELESAPGNINQAYLRQALRVINNSDNTNPNAIQTEVERLIGKYGHRMPARAGRISRGAFGLQNISISAFTTPEYLGAGGMGSINFDSVRALMSNFGANSSIVKDFISQAKTDPLIHDAKAFLANISGKAGVNVVNLDDVLPYITDAASESVFNPNFTERQATFRKILARSGQTAVGNQISLGIRIPGTEKVVTVLSGLGETGGYTIRPNSQLTLGSVNESAQSLLEALANGESVSSTKGQRLLQQYERAGLSVISGPKGFLKGAVYGKLGLYGSAVSGAGLSKTSKFTDMLMELDQIVDNNNPLDLHVADKFMGVREKFFANKLFGTYTNLTKDQIKQSVLYSGMSVGVNRSSLNKVLASSPASKEFFAQHGYGFGVAQRFPVMYGGNVPGSVFYDASDLADFSYKNFGQRVGKLGRGQFSIGGLVALLTGGDFDGDNFSMFLPDNSASIAEIQNILTPNSKMQRLINIAEQYSIKSAGSQDYYKALLEKGIDASGMQLSPAARRELMLNVEAQQQLEKRIVGKANPLLQRMAFSMEIAEGQFSIEQREKALYLVNLINENIIKGRQKLGPESLRTAEEFIDLFQTGSFSSKSKQDALRELTERILSNDPSNISQSAKIAARSMDDLTRAMALAEGNPVLDEFIDLIKNNENVSPERIGAILNRLSDNSIINGTAPTLESRTFSASSALRTAAKMNKGPLLAGLGVAAGISMLFAGGRSSFDVPSQREMIRSNPQFDQVNPGWSKVPTDAAILEHTQHNIRVHAVAPRHYDYQGMGQMMGNSLTNSNVNINVRDFRRSREAQEVRTRMGY